MPHDEHFLSRLDRVSVPQVEFALSLYNDAPLVRLVLQDARVPERAARVALALGDAARGPFVIVARDGGFVTCLGEGMSPAPHPVVSRAQIDGTLSRLTDVRARYETAMRLTGRRGRVGALLERIFTAGEFLAREEVHALGLWQPLLRAELAAIYFDLAVGVERLRARLLEIDRPRAADAEAYEAFWLSSWACAHLLVLVATDGREDLAWHPAPDVAREELGWALASHGVQCFSLRSAWAMGRLARAMLPVLKNRFATAETLWALGDAVLGLVTIGAGHARLRAEVRKKLDVAAPPEAETETADTALRALRWSLGTPGVEALDADEAVLRAEALGHGRRYHHEINRAHPPDGVYRFATAAEVPDDLATAALFDARWDVHETYSAIRRTVRLGAVIARLAPEDLYYPKAYHARWDRGLRPRYVEDLLAPRRRVVRPRAPVRAAAQPGRNDPCPCGSGKKYKKCCGA